VKKGDITAYAADNMAIQEIADMVIKEASARRERGEHQNFAAAVHAICMEVDGVLIPVMIEANEAEREKNNL